MEPLIKGSLPSNYFKILKSTKSFLKNTKLWKSFASSFFFFFKGNSTSKTRKENLLRKHRSKLRSPLAVHLLVIQDRVESRPPVDMFLKMANTKLNLSVSVLPKWRRNKSRDKTLKPFVQTTNPSSLPDSLCSKSKVNETKRKPKISCVDETLNHSRSWVSFLCFKVQLISWPGLFTFMWCGRVWI